MESSSKALLPTFSVFEEDKDSVNLLQRLQTGQKSTLREGDVEDCDFQWQPKTNEENRFGT